MSCSGLEMDREPDKTGDAAPNVITKWRYTPHGPHARQRMQEQVYYLQCRDRQDAEDETRELFTATDTGIDRATARSLLTAHPDRTVAFHRYILSPSMALGLEKTEDLMGWARDTLQAYGAHLGQDLTWVAAVHGNTGRPHVHVLIAGAGCVLGTDHYKTVRIKTADHAVLKERGIAAATRIADRRSVERAATLRRELDAMVYRPTVPVTPHRPQNFADGEQPIGPVRAKEKPRESLINRLFRRGA